MYKKILLVVVLLLLCSCTKASKNVGALKYKNNKCTVYYPNNETIKAYAESLCVLGQEDTIDYSVSDMGDFKFVTYPDGLSFYTEEDFSDPSLQVKERFDILSNEIRYQMKKDNLDIAYTSDFLIKTAKENINPNDIEVSMDNDYLNFYFKDFDYTVSLPIVVAQVIVDRDFGFDKVDYIKRRYINPNRPMLALTFDDGPYYKVDSVIFDLMEKYDSHCSFYILSSRFNDTELESCKRGIELGLEYGSHTYIHEDLSKLSVSDAKKAVVDVSDTFYSKLGYIMDSYRPPYGRRNESLEKSLDMKVILWNVDSKDWKNRDSEVTYYNVMNTATKSDVVLLHSLYESTAEACKKLVPDLIDSGYQLVSVKELMEYLNINSKVFRGE